MSSPPRGHIKLARKMFGPEDLFWLNGEPFTERCAWIDLIQMAAFGDDGYRYRGVDELRRGEFVASVRYLAERWGWSKSRVQRWIKSVSKAGRITGQRMGQHGMIYLLAGYETYNPRPAESGTERGTLRDAPAGQERDRSGTNKKKGKEGQSSSRAGRANWVSEFGGDWTTAKPGAVAPFGEIGRHVKPLVERDGPEAHRAAWQRFCASDASHYGPAYFAKHRPDFDTGAPKAEAPRVLRATEMLLDPAA